MSVNHGVAIWSLYLPNTPSLAQLPIPPSYMFATSSSSSSSLPSSSTPLLSTPGHQRFPSGSSGRSSWQCPNISCFHPLANHEREVHSGFVRISCEECERLARAVGRRKLFCTATLIGGCPGCGHVLGVCKCPKGEGPAYLPQHRLSVEDMEAISRECESIAPNLRFVNTKVG